MYLGNPAALEVVQSQRRHSAVERSGNATFSLTGWSLRPMLYCSAMQFMFFGCCSIVTKVTNFKFVTKYFVKVLIEKPYSPSKKVKMHCGEPVRGGNSRSTGGTSSH